MSVDDVVYTGGKPGMSCRLAVLASLKAEGAELR